MDTGQFPEGTIVIEQVISSDLSRVNRRRILSHSMALLTDKILKMEGAEPEGLVVTVHQSENYLGRPTLVLTATTPQHQMQLTP